ncbi:uncharacterized protein LOC121771536 [Salvia splendens]|uniref:uncharacterized protein LOC121771536 n=1 Tax=Salvia splendens TaxID=180675 RepID=UPI001C27A25E|nr:uncharacterized protein LOC121771536 [Salvia splendens]
MFRAAHAVVRRGITVAEQQPRDWRLAVATLQQHLAVATAAIPPSSAIRRCTRHESNAPPGVSRRCCSPTVAAATGRSRCCYRPLAAAGSFLFSGNTPNHPESTRKLRSQYKVCRRNPPGPGRKDGNHTPEETGG